MGEKGARSGGAGQAAADALLHDLQALGPISSKKMFGGHGVFREGVMFAIVDSEGRCFLKAGPGTAGRFDEAGAARHGRMPYREIPEAVRGDLGRLVEWARAALDG